MVANETGLAALKKQDYPRAKEAFTFAIDKGQKVAWNNMGVLLEQQGDKPNAIAYYTMGARYGIEQSRIALIRLGQTVPSADLKNAPTAPVTVGQGAAYGQTGIGFTPATETRAPSASDGAAFGAALGIILGGAAAYQAGRGGGYMQQPIDLDAPRPRSPLVCSSTINGRIVNTSCN